MGYLSQIVRDARPRAAPSLYAAAAALPSVAPETTTYARLMGDTNAQSPYAQNSTPNRQSQGTAASKDQDEALADVSQERQAPQHARPPPDGAVSPAPQTIVPDARRPASMATPPETSPPKTRAGVLAHQGHVEAGRQTGGQVPGAMPRPASFDVPVRVIDETASLRNDTTQDLGGPEPQATPQKASPSDRIRDKKAIAPGTSVQRIGREGPGDRDFVPPQMPERKANTVAAPVTAPSAKQAVLGHSSVHAPVPSGPTEVRIGEIEIVVQDPPAPRAPAAPRAALTAPSPARFHIRRL